MAVSKILVVVLSILVCVSVMRSSLSPLQSHSRIIIVRRHSTIFWVNLLNFLNGRSIVYTFNRRSPIYSSTPQQGCQYFCKISPITYKCCDSYYAPTTTDGPATTKTEQPTSTTSVSSVHPGSCGSVSSVCSVPPFGGPFPTCNDDTNCSAVKKGCFDGCIREYYCMAVPV